MPSWQAIARRLPLGPQATRLAFWIGAAALGIGIFIHISAELAEGEGIPAIDLAVLEKLGQLRTPWLNGVMVDLTALGSGTLITLFTVIALVVLLLAKDRYGAIQLVLASVGAALLTDATKLYFGRARPVILERLVQVQSYSYPSGHSLTSSAMYLTIGIIVCRYLQGARARAALIAMTVVLIGLIGISRMYLGVHYPSDVGSGFALGTALACLLSGGFSYLARNAGLAPSIPVGGEPCESP